MYNYASEKIGNAVRILATSPGNVKKRLIQAERECLMLQEKDFPIELQKNWKWVKETLNKKGPLIGPNGKVITGAVENTLHFMRNSTGTKIATVIYNLNWELQNNESYL